MGRMGGLAAALLSTSMAWLPACAPLSGKQAPGDTDRKFGLSSYIEEGSLISLIVGARPARFREDRDYMPLEVAVVNKGLKSLTFGPESFTLLDKAGNRYAAVGREELAKGYGNVDLDRRLGEIGPAVRGRYQAYGRLPSTLTPSFDKPVPRRLHLPRYTYVLDFLYFPRPAEGVGSGPFELFLDAPELPDPVFVRFEVKTRARKDKSGSAR